MKEFGDKVVLVTGAASGIGKATAQALASEGAVLVLGDLNMEGTRDVLSGCQERDRLVRGECVSLDVRNMASVDRYVSHAVTKYGRVDALAHCAGIVNGYRFVDMPEDAYDNVLAVNAKGVFLVLQRVGRQMLTQREGSVCVVASRCGKEGAAGLAHYCASKHAVVGLVRSAAQEWTSSGVRVNCVCPGDVDTPLLDRAYAEYAGLFGMTVEAVRKAGEESSLLGRLETPEEIAAAIMFLLSSKSAVIVGQAVNVCGGVVFG